MQGLALEQRDAARAAGARARRSSACAHRFKSPDGGQVVDPEGMLLRSNWTATSHRRVRRPALAGQRICADRGGSSDCRFRSTTSSNYGLWVQQQVAPDVRSTRRAHRCTAQADGFVLTMADGEQLSRPAGRGRGRDRRFRPSSRRTPPAAPGARLAHWRPPRPRPCSTAAGCWWSAAARARSSRRRCCTSAAPTSRSWSAGITSTGCTAAGTTASSAGMRELVYAPTDVGPMGLSRIVAVPERCSGGCRASCRTRSPTGRSARPARRGCSRGSSDVPIHARSGCEPGGDRVGSGCHGRASPTAATVTVDHVMFGTGYRVDIAPATHSWTAGSLTARISRVARLSRCCRPGMESSVPGLHFLGAPAAWSFGPIMRFVAGGWFGGRSLAQALTRRATPDAPRRRDRQVFRCATACTVGQHAWRRRERRRGLAETVGARGRRRRLPGARHRPQPRAARSAGVRRRRRAIHRARLPVRRARSCACVTSATDQAPPSTRSSAPGTRFGLAGWVLYPTREENVAAIVVDTATRCPLYFRVPTPAWSRSAGLGQAR